MKIQLDFDNKTITLEADCELKEFIPVIQRILLDWNKWTLKMEVITNWVNPIPWPIYPYVPITTPESGNPIWDDHITVCGDTVTCKNDVLFTYTSGIVNVDVN